jgi:hypothetical protein
MSPLAAWAVLLPLALPAAEVGVEKLETRKEGDATLFRLTLKAPADLAVVNLNARTDSLEKTARLRGQLPRLVPLDEHARAVHLDTDHLFAQDAVQTLRFLGRRAGDSGPARFRLVYPVAAKPQEGLAGLPADAGVSTAEVLIDWSKAGKEKGADLRRPWARAWAYRLESQHLRSPGVGFFHLARELTARKHGINLPAMTFSPEGDSGSLLGSLLGPEGDRVYQLTTGATALTESLALGRLGRAGKPKPAARTRPVKDVRGIDVAEHPWKKMMGGKKPADEPLARLVPCDNYYLAVADPAALLSAWEVMDAWGGSVLRSPRLLDRDHGVRARYERQLCLPGADLVRALPRGLVRALAVTGSDLFLLEGSDVTLLVDAAFPAGFRKVQDLFVARARKAHGEGLKETSEDYRGVRVEGFATPRREVSLYRATVGKVVVCSNSPTAIRHVIDTHAGSRKALAESLDFQYMRTVFVRDAKEEDGFAFLSDAFIRRLVGPATRIKEMRRQQARAALQLTGHAALFVGLDEGKLPADTKALLAGAALEPDALAVPEGEPVRWDAERREAVSDAYNTLGFTTPLVDLPIDLATPDEVEGYERFRLEYLRLWGRYFDPVGIRFKLRPEQTRVEVYLLPLVTCYTVRTT